MEVGAYSGSEGLIVEVRGGYSGSEGHIGEVRDL